MWQFVKDNIYIIYKYQLQLASSKKATRTYVQEKTNYVCLHVHSCRKLLILHLRIPLFEIYSFIKNGCWIIHNKVTEITIKLFHYVYLHHIFFLQLFSRKAYIYTKLRYMTTQWKFLCGTIFLIKKNRFPWISYIFLGILFGHVQSQIPDKWLTFSIQCII